MWPFANSSCRNFEKCWKFLWHWDTHFRQGKASIWVSVIKMVKKGVVEMGKCIRKYPGSDAGDRNGPFTRVATYIENNFEMNELLLSLKNGLGKQMKSSDWRGVLVSCELNCHHYQTSWFSRKIFASFQHRLDLTCPRVVVGHGGHPEHTLNCRLLSIWLGPKFW